MSTKQLVIVLLVSVILVGCFFHWVGTSTGIQSVGTYGSYGSQSGTTPIYPPNSGCFDAWVTYSPTDTPRNRFNFCIMQLDTSTTAGSAWNPYLSKMRANGHTPILRLFWGWGTDLSVAKSAIQAEVGDVDLSLVGGVILGDDVRFSDNPVFYNSLYDWFKATYPGVAVYQEWAPRENEGPFDGKPGFQSSWKADGWIWYSYWANYNRTKGFIQSCKSAQPNKPIIMIMDFSAPLGFGFDPYTYTPQQVQVAREEGCSVCLFSYSSSDNKFGWWTSNPVTQQRYAMGEALIDEVNKPLGNQISDWLKTNLYNPLMNFLGYKEAQ